MRKLTSLKAISNTVFRWPVHLRDVNKSRYSITLCNYRNTRLEVSCTNREPPEPFSNVTRLTKSPEGPPRRRRTNIRVNGAFLRWRTSRVEIGGRSGFDPMCRFDMFTVSIIQELIARFRRRRIKDAFSIYVHIWHPYLTHRRRHIAEMSNPP